MKLIIQFVITFLISLLCFYLTLNKYSIEKKDKKTKKKYDKPIIKRMPVEIKYFINRYHIDIDKINYLKFIRVISLVSSLDISMAVIIFSFIKSITLQIITGFIVLIPLIYISFDFIGKYYVKKGMTNNEYKRSRK